MEVLFPTQLTGVLIFTTSLWDINRPENKKDRYQSSFRAIDIGALIFVVQFLPKPLQFLLIIADSVHLYTAEQCPCDTAADQNPDQQPCECIHPTSPSLRPRLTKQLFVIIVLFFYFSADSRNDRNADCVACHFIEATVRKTCCSRFIKLFIAETLQPPTLDWH